MKNDKRMKARSFIQQKSYREMTLLGSAPDESGQDSELINYHANPRIIFFPLAGKQGIQLSYSILSKLQSLRQHPKTVCMCPRREHARRAHGAKVVTVWS